MAERLAILLWAAGESRPELCATPFSIAAAAAAMDAEVEIYFAAGSVRLCLAQVAARVFPGQAGERSAAQFMQHARDHGVKFYACAASLEGFGLTAADCAGSIDGLAGASTFAARTLDSAWRTLVF